MGGEPTTEPTSDPPFDDGTPLAPLIPLNPLATLAIEALEPLLILAAPLATFANDSGLSFTSGAASMSTPSTLPCGTAILECGDIGTGVDMPDILAEYTDASSLALSPTPLWTLAVWSRASVCVWWMKRHLVP